MPPKDRPIAYVKIPGIPGGSIRKDFEEQIPIHAYEHKLLRRQDASAGDHIPDTIRMPKHISFDDNIQPGGHSPFVIFKTLDRASVLLYQALDQNKVFDKSPIQVSILQSVDSGVLVSMSIKLTKAVVRSVQYSERGDGGPEERVAFTYSEIEWTFQGLDEGGKKTGSVSHLVTLEK